MLVSGSKFVGYWYLLPFLCLGIGMFYVGQSFTMFGMLLNMPDKYLAPKILSGLLAVLANIIFVHYFGMAGAAISTCVIGIFYLLLVLYVNNKIKIATSFKSSLSTLS
jgi:O-antigen/teichoic acid export membrane protein